MFIAKKQFLDMVKKMPARIDLEELIYRLYLKEKLEAAENDVRHGRLISREAVVRETEKWFK
jgi:hypothetical protein